MEERESALQGDAVQGRSTAEAEEVLGETGALPEESAEDDAAALRAEIEAERRRAAEQLQARARLQADFDNYRKRMLSEQTHWRDDAVREAVSQMLPVFDNLERAARAEGDADAVRKGVDLTLRQLGDVLAGLGVEKIEVAGHEPFDPNRHEAMSQVESAEHGEGEVVSVARPGYAFRGALLRPALVTVAKAGSGREEQG